MDFTDRIPGMKPGAQGRNIAVGSGYLLLLSFAVIFPLLLLVLPFVIAYAVVKNYRGTADRLGGLPGIKPGGGMRVATVAVLYAIVLLFVVGTGLAALGGPVEEPGSSAIPTTSTPEGTDPPMPTEATTVVNAAATTSSADTGPSPTDQHSSGDSASSATPKPSPTVTSTQAATPSPAPTRAARGPAEGTEWTVTITRVMDGDTVEARFPNGEIDTLRLLGVDTPETTYGNVDPPEWEGIPDTTAGRDHLFNWGERASTFASDELYGESVRVEIDPQADRRGYYGRLLVYVYVDGRNFNKRLISEGYARLYESSFSQSSAFESAEAEAQRDDVGVWDFDAPSTPTATEQPSGGPGDLAVAELHIDAAGDDHDNLNEEYIVFENTGDSPIDMGGWTISDEADHEYIVPTGFTLGPGETVTLYTGSGSNTDSKLYWGSGRAVWNNGGDTIYVSDGGTVILEESY